MNFINIIGTLFDNSVNHVVAIANQIKDLRLNRNQQDINEDLFDRISRVDAKKEKSKGLFPSLASLQNAVPEPSEGDWAIISDNSRFVVCRCETEGTWTVTQEEFNVGIPLTEYPKKTDLKTINNTSLIIDPTDPYDNNIQIEGGTSSSIIPIATSEQDGLLSKELYAELETIRTVTLVQMARDIDNIESLIGTNDLEIQNIINKYNIIKDFISNIDPNDDVLAQIMTSISSLQQDISDEMLRAINEENSLKSRVRYLEEHGTGGGGSSDGYHHIVLTQEEYDALETYDNRTIYLIIASKDSWGLGDGLPIILASSSGTNNPPVSNEWKFGQQFPIIFT